MGLDDADGLQMLLDGRRVDRLLEGAMIDE